MHSKFYNILENYSINKKEINLIKKNIIKKNDVKKTRLKNLFCQRFLGLTN